MELVDSSIIWHLSTKVHGASSRTTFILKPFLGVNVRGKVISHPSYKLKRCGASVTFSM